MSITEQDVKKITLIVLVAALAILAFLIIRPVILSIFGGLILAYIFFPVHKFITKYVKYEWISAGIVSFIVLLLIIIPAWFLTPSLMQQTFRLFQTSQSLELSGLISKLLPTASEQVINQIEITVNNALGKITTAILNSLVDFLVNFAVIILHLFLLAFVFFFTLKDNAKLREFASGLSPLNKHQESKLVQQFKDMTSSIINGQVISGTIQGVLAGVGLFLFGIPNALVLTILAVLLGIIPLIGPAFIYIPVAIYLFLSGDPTPALLYLIYNVLIVSTVDNFLKTLIVSKKTRLSQVIILIGMIGGLFLFGFLGIILGPLILAYFITFLRAYKEKTLSSLFASD